MALLLVGTPGCTTWLVWEVCGGSPAEPRFERIDHVRAWSDGSRWFAEVTEWQARRLEEWRVLVVRTLPAPAELERVGPVERLPEGVWPVAVTVLERDGEGHLRRVAVREGGIEYAVWLRPRAEPRPSWWAWAEDFVLPTTLRLVVTPVTFALDVGLLPLELFVFVMYANFASLF